MKDYKNIMYLLITIPCMLHAKTYTNKTFLMPRTQLRNQAMRSTTWHQHINKKGDDSFGGSIQASVFYQNSDNRKRMGKYFGFQDSEGRRRNEISVDAQNTTTDDLFNQDIFHNALAPANTPQATPFGGRLKLRIGQEVLGARFDWYQDLDKIMNGLFFEVTTVVAHVDNDIETKVLDETRLMDVTVGNETFEFGPNTGRGILDYFRGNITQTEHPNLQEPLCFFKIKDGGDSTTELADIEIKLGYNFVHEKDRHLGLSLALLIPTGNTPEGKYLFEAMAGHADHWAFGLTFDAALTLLKRESFALSFLCIIDYRFIFESTEIRTAGLINPLTGSLRPHGPYMLGGQVGRKGVFPLANVLTREMDVEPGSQIDGIVALALSWKNWMLDLGYNLYAQEGEEVKLKSWPDDTYGIADFFYDTTNEFMITTLPGDGIGDDTNLGPLNREQVSDVAAETPSHITHKAYAGLGYSYNNWKYPLMLALGSSYERSENNAAFDQWAFWAKIGISF